MAVGGVHPYSGINNIIIGTKFIDYIFGDPYTTGSPYGQQTGGALSSGRGGNDRLEGVGGDDTIYGDAYFMDTVGIGGNDRLGGGAGDDLLVGDADQLSGAARGGDDLIEGGEGNDEIYGDGRFMLGQSRGGNDVIYGGGGADYVAGDAFYLVDSGIGGNDVIYGGAGDDFSLVGDARGLFNDAQGGHDRVYGGVGNDMVAGDADTMRDNARGGDDFIVGGAGDDELFGDAETYTNFTGVGGQDRFFFALGSGRDRIGDFELGKDLIQIAYAYGFKTFSQLQSRISDDEFGNAVIHLNGSTDHITVLGVASHQLSSADFLFSDEAIRGSSGNNVMNPTTSVAAYRTTASNDVVFGLDGNDVIDGGTGADKMDGGNGNDTFFVDSYTDDGLATNDDQVIEVAGGGKDLVNASVSYRLADNVETLTLIGSAAINGTGNDLGNAIVGNVASNTLTGGLGNDELYAKEGDDTLFGATAPIRSTPVLVTTSWMEAPDPIYLRAGRAPIRSLVAPTGTHCSAALVQTASSLTRGMHRRVSQART